MVRADEKIVATGYTAPWGCRDFALIRPFADQPGFSP
jgi:hypothetical protein